MGEAATPVSGLLCPPSRNEISHFRYFNDRWDGNNGLEKLFDFRPQWVFDNRVIDANYFQKVELKLFLSGQRVQPIRRERTDRRLFVCEMKSVPPAARSIGTRRAFGENRVKYADPGRGRYIS